MYTLYKLEDPYEIKCSLQRDNLCRQILGIDSIIDWNPDFTRASWFLIKQDNDNIGFIFFRDFSGNILTFHAGLYEKHRHRNTVEIFKECLTRVKEEVNCHFIIAIKTDNFPALKVADKLGFKVLKTFKDTNKKIELTLLAD